MTLDEKFQKFAFDLIEANKRGEIPDDIFVSKMKRVIKDAIQYGYNKVNIRYSPRELLPELLPGRNYSAPVFARIKGSNETQVLCLAKLKSDNDKPNWVNCYGNLNADDEWHYFWANCYGNIDGNAELDDNYEVIEWWPINK